MFNDEFYSNLPDDPASAAFSLIVEFNKFNSGLAGIPLNIENYEKYLEAAALCKAFIDVLGMAVTPPVLEADHKQNVARIVAFFNNASKEFSQRKIEFLVNKNVEKLLNKYEILLTYKFTDGDLSRIQELINELRDMINDSKLLESNHKERLLKRLESLQIELHKKMSSIDKFWGFIMDAGSVLKKFGDDAKPIVDRMKELADIIWRTQSISQELPSGTQAPLLFYDKKQDK